MIPKLRVKNLPLKVSSVDLAKFLSQASAITSVEILTNPETDQGLAEATAHFATVGDATRALEQLQGQTLLGKSIDLAWYTE